MPLGVAIPHPAASAQVAGCGYKIERVMSDPSFTKHDTGKAELAHLQFEHLAHAACCILFMMWFDDQPSS